jgi:hypothetical protein
MLKKTMTYADIDGNPITKDFYFNMTKAELLKLEFSEDAGFSKKIERIQKPNAKGGEILETFDDILRHSFGIRRGDEFVKPVGAFEEFQTTEAYSDLLFEIATDAVKAANFTNAVMPASLLAEVQDEIKKQQLQGMSPAGVVVDEARQIQDVTPYEVSVHAEPNPMNMTEAELLASLGAEERRTGGYTDMELQLLTPAELVGKPREVLIRAYQLKNQK